MTGRRAREPRFAAAIAVVRDDGRPPDGWDARVVDVPGGSVHQSTVNAAHRAGQGWQPHFLGFEDGRAALVLTRRRPPLPGLIAYASRGPAPAGDPPEQVARRVLGIAAWARAAGAAQLAADPILVASPEYDDILASAGFHPTPEHHAERHRMILRLAEGLDEEGLWRGIAAKTRHEVQAAERAGIVAEEATDDEALATFAGFLAEAARRRGFWIGRIPPLLAWWRRLIDAGLGRLLVARHDGRTLGGMVLYHQGGGSFMAHAADDATVRGELRGASHLLVWTAMRRALVAGHRAFDMGGVEPPGERRMPVEGDSTYGLYKYKRSFGAEWTDCAAAHEIVLRPWLHGLLETASRLGRAVRPRRPPR